MTDLKIKISGAVVLALALLIGGCSEEGPQDAPAAKTDEQILVLGSRDVLTVAESPLTTGVRVTGSLNPATRVELRAELSGQLDRVTVEQGSRVRRGQSVAVFDSRGTRAQLASANAQMASARRDLGAAEMLYKAGAISERDYVQAKVAVDAARAQVTQMQETLERAAVLAPIAGTVTEKLVSSGEAVQSGAKMFRIANIDLLELVGSVPAGEIGAIRVGQRAALILDAYPGEVIGGRVDRIEPVANQETRQVDVYIQVANPGGRLVGGLFATGTILTGSASSTGVVAAVPSPAVQQDGGQAAVYKIEGEVVRHAPVVLGTADPKRGLVEIRSGVNPGDRIILSPSPQIRAGMRVRVEEEAQTAVKP